MNKVMTLHAACIGALGWFLALNPVFAERPSPHPQASTEQPFTLQQVLKETYHQNPDLKAARASLEATKELLPQAFSGWKPTLNAEASIQGSNIQGSNFGGADGSVSKDMLFSLNQPLYRGGRTFAEISSARNTISAQSAALKAAEQQILLDAVTFYMDVKRDRKIVTLNQNNIQVLARQLEATRQRFEVGEITLTDVSQSESRLAESQAALIRAQSDLENSLAAFEQTTGFAAPAAFPDPLYNLNLPETREGAIRLAEKQNPAIVEALYIQKAAEDDVDTVFGEFLPEVSAYASWNRTIDPQPGTTKKQTTETVGLKAKVALYKAGSVRSRIRQAKETSNKNYLEILSAKRKAKEKTIRAWQDLKANQAEILSRQAQVKAETIAQEGVHEESNLGTRTILDTLDADQALLNAQVELEKAKRNKVISAFTLADALGTLTLENLQISQPHRTSTSHQDNIYQRIFGTDIHKPNDKTGVKDVDSLSSSL